MVTFISSSNRRSKNQIMTNDNGAVYSLCHLCTIQNCIKCLSKKKLLCQLFKTHKLMFLFLWYLQDENTTKISVMEVCWIFLLHPAHGGY